MIVALLLFDWADGVRPNRHCFFGLLNKTDGSNLVNCSVRNHLVIFDLFVGFGMHKSITKH